MSIIFFGSDSFSVPSLQACLESPFPVKLVITTPPKKKGRGLKLVESEVELFAREHGLPVIHPQTLKDDELLKKVADYHADYFVVSSYGKLIPDEWLKVPNKIALNVHPSLLPKYRGASPLNWPILNGDQETGLSIMEVVKELDAGDVFYQERLTLDDSWTAESLHKKMTNLSGPAVKTVLSDIEKGSLKRTPQVEAESCYARKLVKEDGLIDLSWSAEKISRYVRGLLPWPKAYLDFRGQPLQILEVALGTSESKGTPGEILAVEKAGGVRVMTGDGGIELRIVKPAGKNSMKAADFIRGRNLKPGDLFA